MNLLIVVVPTMNVIDSIILLDIVIHEVGKPDASVTILFKDVVLELLTEVLLLLAAANTREIIVGSICLKQIPVVSDIGSTLATVHAVESFVVAAVVDATIALTVIIAIIGVVILTVVVLVVAGIISI